MANAMYNYGREAFLDGLVAWKAVGGGDFRTICVDTEPGDYDADRVTVKLPTHSVLADVPVGARVAVSTAMTLKEVLSGGHPVGVADAENVSFTGVTGDSFEELVCYEHAVDRLIFNIDTASGLAFTPDVGGSDFEIRWADSGNYIFKL